MHTDQPAADTPDAAATRPLTAEDIERIARTFAEFTAAAQTIVAAAMQAFGPIVAAVTQQFAALQRQLQDAGLLDADGKPTRPADRPAWQSPYGPAQRRR